MLRKIQLVFYCHSDKAMNYANQRGMDLFTVVKDFFFFLKVTLLMRK